MSCAAQKDTPALHAFQFNDVTELLQWKRDFASAKPCVLILVIDSYDDILQYAKESEKAQVSAEVEKVLESFMTGTNGIIRKIENDMFYAVVETLSPAGDDAGKVQGFGRCPKNSGQWQNSYYVFDWRWIRSEFARRRAKNLLTVAGYGIGTRR